MRAAWPRERALGLRLSATDWVPGGWDIADSVAYAAALGAQAAYPAQYLRCHPTLQGMPVPGNPPPPKPE